MLLNVCYLTDDVDVIETALRGAREHMNPQMSLNRYQIQRGEDILRALKTRNRRGVEESEIPTRDVSYFSGAVTVAHLLRLRGDSSAPKMIAHAQKLLEEYTEDRTALPVLVALHLKNVLAGIPANTRGKQNHELREKADALLQQRIDQGFGLLSILQRET